MNSVPKAEGTLVWKLQKPFCLQMDATEIGLGTILYQAQHDGMSTVIAYASRTLSKLEKNFNVHK